MTNSPPDPWTVAIHTSASDREPIGAGVVIAHNLVLTCEHVVRADGRLRDEIWIAFPKAPGVSWGDRRRVRQCVYNGRPDKNVDVVLLELAEPVPGTVTPARLRCLPSGSLAGRSWWAFGFPHQAEHGGSAHGTMGDTLGYGHIYLDRLSDHGLASGFSGSPVYSSEYDAVVGLVEFAAHGTAKEGDGHALTLFHVDQELPEMKLSLLAAWQAGDADDMALAAWGWVLAADEEARLHWLPRARGVTVDTERGYRFRGRAAALNRLVSWLDRPEPTGRPLIVTGSPGVGKSAVLGRLVTTADRDIRQALPADDDAVRATIGSVGCAVHAKGKTALEVATEVARAVSVGLPAAPADLTAAMRDRPGRWPARFNLVIDALDEMATPDDARQVVHDVVVPLARDRAHFGVQVVVGTRRVDDKGELLAQFGADADIVDLDTATYFTESDLADYALATLRLVGPERAGNPYPGSGLSEAVARRIATLAEGNFLIAGLVARAHGLRDTVAVEPDKVSFTATVADALDVYLAGLPSVGGTSARLILTALAFAETPGLPLVLWRTAVKAVGGAVDDEDLATFARSSAANFLVETGTATEPAYRLFHQALNEALTGFPANARQRQSDERNLVYGWIRYAHGIGWAAAPDYLFRALPRHAARAGLIDTLLNDDDYLLHAHLGRLMAATDLATTDVSRARAQLLQRTPLAATAPPAERAALFSVVDKLDSLGSRLSVDDVASYRARWAHTPPRLERTVLEGHFDAVYDVCAVSFDGRNLLASAGEDGTVRLWDPLTSQNERVLDCHSDCVEGVCEVDVGGAVLIATASHDHTVGLWDPRNGTRIRTLRGHRDWIRNICAVPVPDGRTLLATASDDRTVRLWDPADGSVVHTLHGHTGWVTAVCHVPAGSNGFLASAGVDGDVRLWDPVTGRTHAVLVGHDGWVTTLHSVRLPDGALVASAGYDGTVRLWDPLTGMLLETFDTGAGPLTDLCTLATADAVLIASTGEDGAIRLWDAATGVERPALEGGVTWIRAICELTVGDRQMLATAGDDGTVRLWDVATGQPQPTLDSGRIGPVAALSPVRSGDEILVASAGVDGSVRLWDPIAGGQRREIQAHPAAATSVCAFVDDGHALIAVASENRKVVMWDLDTEFAISTMSDHHEKVNAVCSLRVAGRTIVASAGDDETIRLWNPHNAAVREILVGHRNWVTALVAVDLHGHQALASADKSGTIRLWDATGAPLWERQGHYDAVNALCTIDIGGRTMLVSAGADHTIRLWDPREGVPGPGLSGHTSPVTGVCAMPIGGRPMIASTSLDRTVRIWDPGVGRLVRSIPVYHRALACCYVPGALVVGLERGLLALDLDDTTSAGVAMLA